MFRGGLLQSLKPPRIESPRKKGPICRKNFDDFCEIRFLFSDFLKFVVIESEAGNFVGGLVKRFCVDLMEKQVKKNFDTGRAFPRFSRRVGLARLPF